MRSMHSQKQGSCSLETINVLETSESSVIAMFKTTKHQNAEGGAKGNASFVSSWAN